MVSDKTPIHPGKEIGFLSLYCSDSKVYVCVYPVFPLIKNKVSKTIKTKLKSPGVVVEVVVLGWGKMKSGGAGCRILAPSIF